jgi:hypothetical protein
MGSAGQRWRALRRWLGCTDYGHLEIRLTNSGSLGNAEPLQGEPLSMRPTSGCLGLHILLRSQCPLSCIVRGPGTRARLTLPCRNCAHSGRQGSMSTAVRRVDFSCLTNEMQHDRVLLVPPRNATFNFQCTSAS